MSCTPAGSHGVIRLDKAILERQLGLMNNRFLYNKVDYKKIRIIKMDDSCEKTIQFLGARSSGAAMGVTLVFALLGATMPMFFGSASFTIWIPLCCMTIPPVHYLSRELLRQRKRIADLEKRLNER